MAKLDGKVAVITGGTSGIGLATAELFIQEGATVIIIGRNKTALDNAVQQLGDKAVGLQADVSKLTELDALYHKIGSQFTSIDIVFANAGIVNPAPFSAITAEHFDREFDVNVRGVFFSVQKALPLLRDGGSIILNASVAHSTGFPGHSLYGAAKAAVRAFARNWTSDLKERRIRVNSISPGPTETPIVGKMGLPIELIQAGLPAIIGRMPMGRTGYAHEIASAALFLASDDSSFITGIDLPVDGGLGQV